MSSEKIDKNDDNKNPMTFYVGGFFASVGSVLQLIFVILIYYFGSSSMVPTNPTFSKTYSHLSKKNRRTIISIGITNAIAYILAFSLISHGDFSIVFSSVIAGILGILTFMLLSWKENDKRFSSEGNIHSTLTFSFLLTSLFPIWFTYIKFSKKENPHSEQGAMLVIPSIFLSIATISIVLLVFSSYTISRGKGSVKNKILSNNFIIHAYAFELIYTICLAIYLGMLTVLVYKNST